MKIQLIKETKENSKVVYFIMIGGYCKSAHYNFDEAVKEYNHYVEVHKPKVEEVIMETEIDY